MRRVYIPSAPLSSHGQVSELRLAQLTAVAAPATLTCSETRSIAVHEPNLLGLTGGANTVCAETGANPRDTEKETTGHRGRDIKDCKMMLYEAGFERLLTSPGRGPFPKAGGIGFEERCRLPGDGSRQDFS
jgi:biotin synthase